VRGRLNPAGEAAVGGRQGFRVRAEPPAWIRTLQPDATPWRIAVIIDAELGIVLRQVRSCGATIRRMARCGP
jgi:hypothetical protein